MLYSLSSWQRRRQRVATPKAIAIELSETEAAELASRLRRRKVARADAMRAEIVLLAAEGVSNLAIAERLGITRVTVTTWRRRFAVEALGWSPGRATSRGSAGHHRPEGCRRGHDDAGDAAGREDAVELAWHGTRIGAGQQSMVQRIWKAFSLATAPQRDLQAVDRSAVRRQGA